MVVRQRLAWLTLCLVITASGGCGTESGQTAANGNGSATGDTSGGVQPQPGSPATPTTPTPPTDPTSPADPAHPPYEVLYTIDGDTIVVNINGVEEHVRFKGINSPEIHTTPIEFMGPEAHAFTKAHVGKYVDLIFDSRCETPPLEKCRDIYHRLLAYVQLADGTDLNRLLVAQGLARLYIFRGEVFDRVTDYRSAQTSAKNNHLGIWTTVPH